MTIEGGIPNEICSTPRTSSRDASAALVSQSGELQIERGSPAGSDESEADILERSILCSSIGQSIPITPESEQKLQHLTNDIEPTTVFSCSIMHTAESPSQLTYNPAELMQQAQTAELQPASSYFVGSDAGQGEMLLFPAEAPPVSTQPSAPTLQEIHASPGSVPLMDVSKFQTPVLGSPSRHSHLGRRVSADHNIVMPNETPAAEVAPSHIAANAANPPAEVTNTSSDDAAYISDAPKTFAAQSPADPSSPQERFNSSLSPISSPNTSQLLKPPIHWYFSNPDGSWNPFSRIDSERIEDINIARANGECFK